MEPEFFHPSLFLTIPVKNLLMISHHIHLSVGDIGKYVFLPGDPGRSEIIAGYFDNPEPLTRNREYRSYSGTLLGQKVSVVSTGIGCPSTAIAMEELIAIGGDTFIRVGTAGGMQSFCKTGDIAIINASIRDEGTTSHYLPIEFPAIADIDVVLAMKEGAERIGIPYHVGVSQSKDSFYGEVEPDRMPIHELLQTRWKAWVCGGAICSEMETAAILILSSIHKKRAGGVMLMAGSEPFLNSDDSKKHDFEARFDIHRAIRVAIEGVRILIQKDLRS